MIRDGDLLEAVAVNTYPEILIEGEKTWNLKGYSSKVMPDSVTVYLYQNGEKKDSQTVKQGEDGKWTYSFTAPRADDSGTEYTYSVKEDTIPNFKPVYSTDGYDILNVYTPPTTDPDDDPKPKPDPDKDKDPDDGKDPDKDPDKDKTPDKGTTPDSGTTHDSGTTPDKGTTPDSGTKPDSGKTPDSGTKPSGKSDVPKTGDDRVPGLWLTLGGLSLAGLFGCLWYDKSHRYRGRRYADDISRKTRSGKTGSRKKD